MKNKLFLVMAISAFGISFAGCSASFSTVTAGKLSAVFSDYAVADAATIGKDGKKGRAKILVGTDVTDNYVMIVGTDEDKFTANAKIVDEIRGSFEMWSGGASNN